MNITQILATITNPQAARENAIFHIWKLWRAHRWLPELSPMPLACLPRCPGWSIHRLLSIDEDGLSTQCPRGHYVVHPIPASSNEIRGDCTRGIVRNGQCLSLKNCRDLLKEDHPQLWHRLARHRFVSIPRGYPEPFILHAACFHAVELWRDPQNRPARRIAFMLERLLDPAPMFKWVEHGLCDAIQRSELPPEDLADIRLAWPQGVFFLPEHALVTPVGASCAFLGFATLPAGYSAIQDEGQALYATVDKVLVWAFAPETMETYTAELTLAGSLDQAGFHEMASPSGARERAFLRQALRICLLLNNTAALNPLIVEESRLLRERHKKGRRHKDAPPQLYYKASILGLPRENPKLVRSGLRTRGKSPCSHWRQGFSQRHWRGPLKGERKAFIVYHPPQFIAGHQEVGA